MRSLLLALALLAAGPLLAQPQAVLHTSMGDIVIELYPDKSPLTVANFLRHAESGFYDGTIFHRVIRGFVIQGGGFTAELEHKTPGEAVPNESQNRLKNERWTVAMARGEHPDSATSQFYINLKWSPSLDYQRRTPGYTVFGKVLEGRDVVRAINRVKTQWVGPMKDVPVEPVILESVELREAAASKSP